MAPTPGAFAPLVLSHPLGFGAVVSAGDTVRLVFRSQALWLLGLNYFFNTLVRNAVTDWAVSYLAATATVSPLDAGGKGALLAMAGRCLTVLEVGGAAGGFLAGVLSDRFFGGRRGPVMALFSLALIPMPLLLHTVVVLSNTAGPIDAAAPPSSSLPVRLAPLVSYISLIDVHAILVMLIYGLIGVFSFAPHVLNGLAAREYSAPAIQSSAGGFTKALGQVGGAMAGYPLGQMVAKSGWGAFIAVLSASALVSAMFALPLWDTEPWVPSLPAVKDHDDSEGQKIPGSDGSASLSALDATSSVHVLRWIYAVPGRLLRSRNTTHALGSRCSSATPVSSSCACCSATPCIPGRSMSRKAKVDDGHLSGAARALGFEGMREDGEPALAEVKPRMLRRVPGDQTKTGAVPRDSAAVVADDEGAILLQPHSTGPTGRRRYRSQNERTSGHGPERTGSDPAAALEAASAGEEAARPPRGRGSRRALPADAGPGTAAQFYYGNENVVYRQGGALLHLHTNNNSAWQAGPPMLRAKTRSRTGPAVDESGPSARTSASKETSVRAAQPSSSAMNAALGIMFSPVIMYRQPSLQQPSQAANGAVPKRQR
jgi:hypothetical protein